MDTKEIDARSVAQAIVERVERDSKSYNSDGNENYAYSAGAYSAMLKYLLEFVPQDQLPTVMRKFA